MTNRQLELVKLLENNGSLTIRELSQNLYISESTVRRDLAALEKANLIARTDQGIIALKRDHGGVSLSYSLKTYEKEKRLIAREAVKLVEDKSTIFLSSASTTMFMIPLLARKNKLTIITDGLEHALKAASLGIKTICIGGVVIPSGKTASGLLAEEMLSRLHANIAFFSVPHVSPTGNVCHYSAEKIKIIHAMMANCDQNVLLCTTKIISNIAETYLVCHTDDFDRIVSEAPLPPELPLKAARQDENAQE